jgi:hypothetical protein
VTIQDSQHQRQIQIEMAAIGCVSGTLAEWPHLLSALRKYGKRVNKSTSALRAKELSRQICESEGWLPFLRSL